MKNLVLFPSIAGTAFLLVSACVGDKRTTAANADAPAIENVAQVAVIEVPVEEFLKDGSDKGKVE